MDMSLQRSHPLELCVLASGSGGNCSVLRTPGGGVLIDAGIGPRVTAKRLAGTGGLGNGVAAVGLAPLGGDPFKRGWVSTPRKGGGRVFSHAKRPRELAGGDGTEYRGLVRSFYEDRPFEPV